MNPIDAAHKELLEELGFDTKLEFFTKTISHLPWETHFTYWFTGRYYNGKIKVQKEEVDELKFLSEVELKEMIQNGEIYDPVNLAGYPEDIVKRFWKLNS
jgi:8-oxo-dGTP pyrophosphatase MutT (NUDIX family)